MCFSCKMQNKIRQHFQIVAAMTQAIGRWRIDSSPIVEMEHFGIQAKYLSDDRHSVLVYLASWQLNHYTSHDVALYGLLAFRDLDTTLLKTVARDPRTADVTRQLLEQVLRRFHGDGKDTTTLNAVTRHLRSVASDQKRHDIILSKPSFLWFVFFSRTTS